MCGRSACGLAPRQIQEGVGAQAIRSEDHHRENYNVCPGSFNPVILSHNETRTVNYMKWGLVPSFSKTGKMEWNLINARSESAASKGTFRRLVDRKRCAVVAEGFFEWAVTNEPRKQPYYIQQKESEFPFMLFAGLYDCWRNEAGEELYTYTILTMNSNKSLRWIHHRMPVCISTRTQLEAWLNPGDKNSYQKCLMEMKPSEVSFKWHAVPRKFVGNTKCKGPECIQTMEEYDTKLKSSGIHKFFSKAPPKSKVGGSSQIKMASPAPTKKKLVFGSTKKTISPKKVFSKKAAELKPKKTIGKKKKKPVFGSKKKFGQGIMKFFKKKNT